MENIKQLLIENGEYIAYVLGGSGLSFGGFKAYKAMQKQRDKRQDKRTDILEGDVKLLKSDMKTVKLELAQNGKDDLARYETLQKIVGDTNKTIKDFKDKFFQLREGDHKTEIQDLKNEIKRLKNGNG